MAHDYAAPRERKRWFQGAAARIKLAALPKFIGAPMLRHYKHKTDPDRYLYRDESRPISGVPTGYESSADWDFIQDIKSFDQIPEKYRKAVQREPGFIIYWIPPDDAV